ncbi:MAG: hypothetical protein ACI4VF_07115 [Lachnospirales bacterium]
MDNFFWDIFEKSGSIDAIMAYMKYNEVKSCECGEDSWNNNKGE